MSATEAAAIARRAEDILRDTSLQSVRDWKAKNDGGLAVGFMPIYAPRELLWAQGVLPVGLMGGGDLEIIRGDAYYQSYICHIPRSTVELGLDGSLDCLDGVVFPAICDVIRNLSGMWTMMFPDQLVHYLDVPQDFSTEVGGEFYRQDLQLLSSKLVKHGARPLEKDALRAAIRLYNKQSALVRELFELRSEEPWKILTSELYALQRAAMVLPVEESIDMLTDYLVAVRADTSRRPVDQARVVVTGSFCEQPPLGLIKTLERAGCSIVDDDFVQVTRWIKSEIDTEGDPMDALVEAFLHDSIDSPTRYVDEGKKGQELVDRVKTCGAEGVLFCAPSFCDPALLDQPMATAAVTEAGVPWSAFKYSENTGQFGVIREQAGTFADSIKLWSGEVDS